MTQNFKMQGKNIFRLLKFNIIARLFAIAAIFTPLIGNAQQSSLKFEHISLDQGLAQSIVQVIHKDRKGFMWFGTQAGLNKYDGYKFTDYKSNPFDSTRISNSQIQAICEDRNGDLWIGTFGGGLNRFDREKEVFSHYRYDPDDPNSLGSDFVQAVYEDSKL